MSDERLENCRLHRLRQHRDWRQDHARQPLRRRSRCSKPSRSAARSSPRSPTATGRGPATTAARCQQHAIHMVQRNLTPGGDKNGADINLALDALEMAFTHSHINSFVIVSGDSDFISLVEKLKQYDRKVLVVGGRAFTSVVMQKNCNEFIAYENLIGRGEPAAQTQPRQAASRPVAGDAARAARAEAAQRPRSAAAARPAEEHAAAARLGVLRARVRRRHRSATSCRSSARPGYVDAQGQRPQLPRRAARAAATCARCETLGAGSGGRLRPPAPDGDGSRARRERVERRPQVGGQPRQHGAATESAGDSLRAAPKLDGYRVIHDVFNRPRRGGRCIVRQVKQIIRSVDEPFDERATASPAWSTRCASASAKVCCALDRDRQGVLRVFPGPLLQSRVRSSASEASRRRSAAAMIRTRRRTADHDRAAAPTSSTAAVVRGPPTVAAIEVGEPRWSKRPSISAGGGSTTGGRRRGRWRTGGRAAPRRRSATKKAVGASQAGQRAPSLADVAPAPST